MEEEHAWSTLQREKHTNNQISNYVSKVSDFDLRHREDGHTSRAICAICYILMWSTIILSIGLVLISLTPQHCDKTWDADFWWSLGLAAGMIYIFVGFLIYMRVSKLARLIDNSIRYRRAYISEREKRIEDKKTTRSVKKK